MSPVPDFRWKVVSITKERLESLALWLKEKRELPESSVIFHFDNAGDLILYSWFHYPFASLAFFHAVLGIERSLRIIYGDEKTAFQALFKKAVAGALVLDTDLSRVPRTPKNGWMWKDELLPSYCALLSRVIPSLRNSMAHGGPLITEQLLPIIRECREIADALWKRGTDITSKQKSVSVKPPPAETVVPKVASLPLHRGRTMHAAIKR